MRVAAELGNVLLGYRTNLMVEQGKRADREEQKERSFCKLKYADQEIAPKVHAYSGVWVSARLFVRNGGL